MLIRNFDEKRARTQRSIDYAGAGILAVGATLLILGLLEGGQAWAWSSPISLGIFAAGVVFLIVFVLVERRAAEPVLPLWVFTRRVLAASSLVSLLVGAIVLGLTTYVPTFTQGVLGTGALVAGFALATLTIGWPIAASQSGRVYLRFGFRVTATAGSLLVVAGTALTLSLSIDSAVWQVAICCFVIGGGMGLVASPTLIAAQSSVDWSERGVVTSTNMFARSIGSAVGSPCSAPSSTRDWAAPTTPPPPTWPAPCIWCSSPPSARPSYSSSPRRRCRSLPPRRRPSRAHRRPTAGCEGVNVPDPCVDVLVASYLEQDLVDRIADCDPRVRVSYAPDLLPGLDGTAITSGCRVI